MNCFDRLAIIEHLTTRSGILEERPEEFRPIVLCFVGTDHNLNSKGKSPGLYNRDRLGMTQFRNEKRVLRVAALHGLAKMHRLRCSSAFIKERSVRNRKCGQIRHHRLEIQKRLEPPLRNLSLVRSVLRIPTWILENIALNDRRHNTVVISHSDI